MLGVVAAAERAVPTIADHTLLLRGAYCYATVAVIIIIISSSSSSTNTNIIKEGVKPNQWKVMMDTNTLVLRRMVVMVMVGMAVRVRVESRRLRYWIARRALKMLAFFYADVFLV
jgi:hypothetical protein